MRSAVDPLRAAHLQRSQVGKVNIEWALSSLSAAIAQRVRGIGGIEHCYDTCRCGVPDGEDSGASASDRTLLASRETVLSLDRTRRPSSGR